MNGFEYLAITDVTASLQECEMLHCDKSSTEVYLLIFLLRGFVIKQLLNKEYLTNVIKFKWYDVRNIRVA